MTGYRSGTPSPEESARLAAGVGAMLAAARERAGLTQAALGRLAGASPATVGAYERGRTRPSWRTLCRLAAALHPDSPIAADALAHDLADATGPSLAGSPDLPATVAREMVAVILERAVGNLGLDVTDERVRTAVVTAVRQVAGTLPDRAIEAARPVRNP